MKDLIHRLAWWLWLKTYRVTATEIMYMERTKKEFDRVCWKCGERIYPILKGK